MKEVLSENNVKFAYVDICAGIGFLKMYLKIRDTSDAHAQARSETHAAGIPSVVIDDEVFIVHGPDHMKELIEKYNLAE